MSLIPIIVMPPAMFWAAAVAATSRNFTTPDAEVAPDSTVARCIWSATRSRLPSAHNWSLSKLI